MAKDLAADLIMPSAKMKPLLLMSKKEPVQAAVALSADGDGLLLLDKKMKPRKVAGMMKTAASKAKIQLNASSVRFGRAEIDPEYDPGTVRFFVNKDAPGAMRMKLIEVVKRAGVQRVEFSVDPSLEEEPEEDAEAEQSPDGSDAHAAPEQDESALKQRLTALVQRIPQALAVDPSRKAHLLDLAKQSQARIADNQMDAAAALLGELEVAVNASAPATSAAPPPPQAAGAVTYGKARLAWLQMRKQLEGDLEKLRQSLVDAYDGTEVVGDVNREFSNRVGPIMDTLDESLADLLDEATNATDPEKRAALVEEARAAIRRYESFLQSESLFKALDSNPFVKLGSAAAMSKTLTTLSAALR